MEFELTRRLISQLDDWLARLAKPLLPARRVFDDKGEFHWEFSEQSPRALQVSKAVRMISGIRGALHLADAKYTAECISLLRLVSDFSQEIVAVSEGLLEGRLTQSQERFLQQYFASIARTPEELEQRERDRYVSREELLKAHYRLAAKTIGEAERQMQLRRFLNYGYDKYVHGAYLTALELYSERDNRFMLSGHESTRFHHAAMTCVAGKLHEVLIALALMAMTAKDRPLHDEVHEAIKQLDESPDYSGSGLRNTE